MAQELSQHLEVTAQEYFSKCGLTPLPNTALGQMSTPLRQVSGELLMFGADVWPPAAFDNILTLPMPRSAVLAPAAAMVARVRTLRHASSRLRYAATLLMGVISGTAIYALAFVPIAQAWRAPPQIVESVHIDTPQIHLGEPFRYTKIARMTRPCIVTINRTFLDAMGNIVARRRDIGAGYPVTSIVTPHPVVVTVPGELAPGRYTYRALIGFECDNGEKNIMAQSDLPFEILAVRE